MSFLQLKRIIAHCLGNVCEFDKIISKQKDRYILCFHRVISHLEAERDGMHDSLWISPERLIALIEWMREVGDIVDCIEILNTEINNDRPLFALSFDDGWKDTYSNAFPILKHYNVPATVFLVSNALETGDLFWTEDIRVKTSRIIKSENDNIVKNALLENWPEIDYRKKNIRHPLKLKTVDEWVEVLKRVDRDERRQRIDNFYQRLGVSKFPLKGYIMTWDDARRMKKHHIRFGSHSHSHAILENLPSKQIEKEVDESKDLISKRLQIELESFCYPNGRYSGREAALLSNCGYRYGFILNNMSLKHCKNKFYTPRFIVNENNMNNLSYFKMCLLQIPLYRLKPHKTNVGKYKY